MDSCFKYLVSYKKTCLGDAANGGAKYLIQNLPAINTEFLTNIAGFDTVSAAQIFEDTLNFNVNLMSERLRGIFENLIVLNDLFQNLACMSPSVMTGVQFETAQNSAFGNRFVFQVPSNAGYFFIEKLRILANNAISSTIIKITEDDGTVTTFDRPILAGVYNDIFINYRVKTNQITITTEGVNLARFPCFETTKGCGCGGSKPQNSEQQKQNDFFNIGRYNEGTNVATFDGHIFGIQPYFIYKCDSYKILCKYRERFALPLLYFTGAGLLEQSFTNERLNITTITDVDQRRAVIADYYKKGNSYLDEAAKQVEQTIRATKGDSCFVCTGRRAGWLTN